MPDKQKPLRSHSGDFARLLAARRNSTVAAWEAYTATQKWVTLTDSEFIIVTKAAESGFDAAIAFIAETTEPS